MIFKLKSYIKSCQRGFSLVEIAIVVVVLSIIAFPMVEYLSTIDRVDKYKETRVKIRAIQDAIANYYKSNENSTLPAPSDIRLSLDDANVGKIASSQNFVTLNDQGQNVFYGAVPVTDLGLSINYLVDAWGNKFSYYVSQISTASNAHGSLTSQFYDHKNSLSDSSLTYVIISHGEDGYGAFNKNGSQNLYDKASDMELNNIFNQSSPATINSSNPLQISTGSLGDISYGQKKEGIILNYAGNSNLDLLKKYSQNITIAKNNSAIGIGSDNPRSALTVASAINQNVSTQQAFHTGILAGSSAGMELVSNDGSGGWIDFLHKNTGNSDFKGRIRYWNDDNRFEFYTNSSARLWLKSDGKLGIGNSAPWQALEVNGWIHPSENYGIRWKDNAYGGSGDSAYIQFIEESGNNSKLRIANNNDSNDDISLYQYGDRRMTFENGNIYIYGILYGSSDIFSKNGYMGRYYQSDSNYAHFGNRSRLGSGDYMLLQHYNGTSYINSSNGRNINFSIGNSGRFYIYNGGVRFYDGRNFSFTHAGCDSNFRCDGTFQRSGGQMGIWVDDWLYIRDNYNARIYIYFNVDNRYTYARGYYYYSDERYKENIRTLGSILDKFMHLEPRIYDHRKDSALWNDKAKQYNFNIKGLIAQEVKKIFPQAVNEDDQGYYSINHDTINMLTIKALQEVNIKRDKEIAKLELLIKQIENKINQLEQR